MSDALPPDDRPDVLYVGPVGPIPILHEDDPRFAEERAAWSKATREAQAMVSPDELLEGLRNADWRVRFEVIDRVIAKAKDDPRTLPRLLELAENDPAWEVREAILMRLHQFARSRVLRVLRDALNDPHPEARWSARYALDQLG